MSGLSDAIRAIRDVLLLQSQVKGLELALSDNNTELKRMSEDLIRLSVRLARLEGMIDGFGMAAAAQARLPRDNEGR